MDSYAKALLASVQRKLEAHEDLLREERVIVRSVRLSNNDAEGVLEIDIDVLLSEGSARRMLSFDLSEQWLREVPPGYELDRLDPEAAATIIYALVGEGSAYPPPSAG